jgi:hypothetical protein
MKTTIDINSRLFKRAKIYAAQNGETLKTIIESALAHELSGTKMPRQKRRVAFPILKSKRPGTLNLTNAQIEEFLT